MKSHILLAGCVLADAGIRCSTSTIRDLKTITERVEHEGLSFLTITLPSFCEDFQKALARGRIDSTDFQSFRKSGCLPRFLSGFTSQVFDVHNGVALNQPSVDAIQAVRQITLLFGKLEIPCSDARTKAAMLKYVETEQSVRDFDQRRTPVQKQEFEDMVDLLWHNVLNGVNREVVAGNVVPKHGPGATADRLTGNRKYEQRQWTERLEKADLLAGEFLFPSWSHYNYDSPAVDWLDPGAEIPVRVVSVPKTLKAPRIIAIEPTCMQYVQQGFWELIQDAIESHKVLGRIVGFTDQVPNQDMAREGSLTGELATLDLSEASDRVSNQLVRSLLRRHPQLAEGVDACRSRKADVPGHGVLRLAKFASMGSALCFPIEAMVFATIVFIGIARERATPLSYRDIKHLSTRVRIYGDDIIVPVEYVHSVIRALTDFGLVVNSDKSFWTGKFRESCGKEYYNGEDVSVSRYRRVLPSERTHVQEIVSAVSLRNQMYFAGYWKTANFLDGVVERLIPFPNVAPESPALGRHSFLGTDAERECPYLQRPLVWAARVRAIAPKSPLGGSGALLKFFLKRSVEPSADKNHLERAGRPDAVSIKLGWTSAT